MNGKIIFFSIALFFLSGSIFGALVESIYGGAPEIPSKTDERIAMCIRLGGSYVNNGNWDADCLIEGTNRFIRAQDLIP